MTQKYNVKLNETYNSWTVIEEKPYYFNCSHRYFKCNCKCGKQSFVKVDDLVKGKNKSCYVCHTKEYDYSMIKHSPTHATKDIGDLSRAFYNDFLSNARGRKLEVTITHEELWDLFLKQDRKCALSGVDLKLSTDRIARNKPDRTKISASIDRIDSSKGYIQGNVQWVHKWINMMKGATKDEDFIWVCKKIANYNKNEDRGNTEPSSLEGHMQRTFVRDSKEKVQRIGDETSTIILPRAPRQLKGCKIYAELYGNIEK